MTARWLACVALVLLTGYATAGEGACDCVQARTNHGWCLACGVGFIAGVEIRSETLWEALDAHGHDLDPAGLTCPVCATAFLKDGYCEEHLLGFVGGQAYYSRLTYHIARGRTVDLSTTSCPTCRMNAEKGGWCNTHQVGMVGNVAIQEREHYEDAVRAFRVLLSANRLVDKCDLCAAAMAIDGRCPEHKLRYTDGVGKADP